jgi:glyoxylase-like metal-dependent hydrolase (beta-lactamase superfamily II)
MSSDSELSFNVHVAPMRGFVTSAAPPAGIRPMWSPLSSTLIAGERDAILVDTTITHDQVDRLADWVERFGKQVVGVVITHGHSDHWIGLARLQERFPHARGLATRDVLARARFEATDEGQRAYWRGLFPGEIPEVPVLPELFDGDSIDLDGHKLRVIDIGQGDTEHSTIVHVPSLRAVVAGDVVYNQVHMLTALTDATAREAWIASIGSVAALDPDIVVAGHKRVGAPDSRNAIEQSEQYLRDFSRIAAESDTAEQIVAAMLELHGDRDNPYTLWFSAQAAVRRD